MARQAFAPTHEQRQLVEQLAAFGIPQEDICTLVVHPHDGKAISQPTLRKHFAKELKSGGLKANVKVAQNLYRIACGADKGAVAAAIFWLKTRAGWKEVNKVEVSTPDGPLQHTLVPVNEKTIKAAVEKLESDY